MPLTHYEWMDAYCLAKPGAQKDYKAEWNAVRYLLGGKMFAMVGGDKEGRPIISVKLEPEFGEFVRRSSRFIVPGYYMNKTHWSSVYLEGDVPDSLMREMLDRSWRLIFTSLSKKVQAEIQNTTDQQEDKHG